MVAGFLHVRFSPNYPNLHKTRTFRLVKIRNSLWVAYQQEEKLLTDENVS